MTVVGFSDSEKGEVYRVVSAVLWLGNISFTEDNKEKSHIEDRQGNKSFCVCVVVPIHARTLSLSPLSLTQNEHAHIHSHRAHTHQFSISLQIS